MKSEPQSIGPNPVSVENLTFGIGGLQILHEVTLSVGQGEIVCLAGANGAGKTTLLNIASGLYRPAANTVWIHGHDISRLKPHEMASLGVARSFQEGALVSDITVEEYVMLGQPAASGDGVMGCALGLPWLRGSERTRRSCALGMLRIFDLHAYRSHVVGLLPFGIAKMVDVARVLSSLTQTSSGTGLLLADEPTTGVDADGRSAIVRALENARDNSGLSVMIVEHDMAVATHIADRLVMMDQGEVIGDGAPGEVLSIPRVRDLVMGNVSDADQLPLQ